MEMYEYTLPLEQWRQVLANVGIKDLCNVALTSRHMNSVASLPELWAGMKVNIWKVGVNGLAELYKINRFKKVKEINLSKWELECEELERLLKEIPGTPLQNANLRRTNLSGLSADLLASAVSHLHIVNLGFTRLTIDQVVSLLKASLSSTTLRDLNLKCINQSKVPAELLANSISRLQEANLSCTGLTTDQCVALQKASLTSTTLRNVNLDCINLSKVPAELLANSFSRLQDVSMHATSLTTHQCVALLKANLTSTTLRTVDLTAVDLSGVPAELLANSISRLQNVNLCRTGLTTVQCVALLKAICCSTTLHHINVEDNQNTQELPADQKYLLASLPEHVRAKFSITRPRGGMSITRPRIGMRIREKLVE